MTRMSNENLMSSPGIHSSYLYRVSTRCPHVSKELIMYLTPMPCHTHVNCCRSMCFHHTDIPVINCSFLLSHFHYFFPFNFFSCSIYSIGKYMSCHVTEGVTMSHQRSHHTSFGWEHGIIGAQTIRNVYK